MAVGFSERGEVGRVSLMQAVFFALILILCPITGYAVDEKAPKDKKTVETQSSEVKKSGESDQELYTFEEPTVEEQSYVWDIIKLIFVLGAFVVGFYYFYKFVTKKTGVQTLGRDVIKILSIVPVGQNKFLQVVDLAGKIMVLGVSDSNINLITEINDKDEIDRIRLLSSKSGPVQPGGFQEHISKYISKFLQRGASEGRRDTGNKYQENESEGLDYLKIQRERLKKINGNKDEL